MNQENKQGKEPSKETTWGEGGMQNMKLQVNALEERETEPGTGSRSAVGRTGGAAGSEAFVIKITVNDLNEFMKNFRHLELRVEKCGGMKEGEWESESSETTPGEPMSEGRSGGMTTGSGTTAGGNIAEGSVGSSKVGTTGAGATEDVYRMAGGQDIDPGEELDEEIVEERRTAKDRAVDENRDEQELEEIEAESEAEVAASMEDEEAWEEGQEVEEGEEGEEGEEVAGEEEIKGRKGKEI